MNYDHFCRNPKCDKHIAISKPQLTMRMICDGQYKEFKRERYASRTGNQIYFCEVCAEAVKMAQIAEENQE